MALRNSFLGCDEFKNPFAPNFTFCFLRVLRVLRGSIFALDTKRSAWQVVRAAELVNLALDPFGVARYIG